MRGSTVLLASWAYDMSSWVRLTKYSWIVMLVRLILLAIILITVTT